MKAFLCVLVAIAAVHAEPEADPNLVYTDGTFHTNAANLAKGVHTQYTAGRVGSLYNVAPSFYKYNVAPAAVYSSPVGYRLFKREAEAEADPALLINPYTAGYVRPAVYSTYARPAVFNAYKPYSSVYNPYRLYKREAESEPEADPALLINPYNVGYVRPSVYSTGYATPSVYNYNAYNAYNLYNPYRIYKREAEAEPEADPALLINPYNAGYVRPSVYSTYARPASVYNYNAYSAYTPYRYFY